MSSTSGWQASQMEENSADIDEDISNLALEAKQKLSKLILTIGQASYFGINPADIRFINLFKTEI